MDDLELALDNCLQQLAAGNWSLAKCLAKYPQYAAELRPLLETALQLQQGKTVRPPGSVRDRTRAKVADYIDTHPRQHKVLALPTKVGAVILALVLVLAITGTGFAQNALPGQLLYSLKLSTERAWRAAAGDPVNVDLALANRRTDELIRLAKTQNLQARDAALTTSAESQGIAAYTDVLDRLDTETDGPNGDAILTALQQNQVSLSQAGIHVPKLDDVVSHAKSHKGQGNGQGNGPTNKP